ncbi:MAG: ClpXP protease specificity-enhancing factor SspB [Holosporales bacterium]|jgi:hypothetical protein|nr:ClpXP protease specificity-enhancing factor SspB [Holosporales bacterium]
MANKIDYDKITQRARVSIVKDIIKHIGINGLGGKQHLYITFLLNHPDSVVSEYLKEEFDDEMTIVIQYEFWDLKSDNHGFSVSLAFDYGDEKIYVPFSAISNINDPSEDFYLDLVPDLSDIKKSPSFNAESSKSDGNIISLDLFRKDK